MYLAFNIGDDLFLDIFAKKYPEHLITINYLGNDYNKFLSKYTNVKKRTYSNVNRIMTRLKLSNEITNYRKIAQEHDILIFLGGSIFREESYHTTLYQDRMNIVKEFKNLNKPILVLGANFGPYCSNEFKSDYKTFFELCDDVCFRDLYSYALYKELSNVRYAPDIVFQMPIDKLKMIPQQLVAGYSIIDLRHKYNLTSYLDEYITSTVKSIEFMVSKGYKCCLMSFCKKEGDLEIIKIILSKVKKNIINKIFIYDYRGDLIEALQLIATFKIFVAARFHANILALLLGIGVLPIIYSDKTANLLKDLNLDELLVYMNNLEKQYNEEIINKVFNNKYDMESIINHAENQFHKLDEVLSGKEFSKLV